MVGMTHYVEEGKKLENPDDLDLLSPKAAADYLAKKWKRPFSAKDFINLRINRQAEFDKLNIAPAFSESRMTLWRRSDLDKLAESMEPPRLRTEIYGKPRRKRKGMKGDEGEESDS